MIISAAIKYNGVIMSMPKPARHNDILSNVYAFSNGAAVDCEQGFLLDDGRFVTRIAAKAYIKRVNQWTIADTHPTQLFSEDLW